MKTITRQEARRRGLKRFFTGKPCKHGHVAERWVSFGGCVECSRTYLKANPDKSRSYVRASLARQRAKTAINPFCKYGRVAEHARNGTCVECKLDKNPPGGGKPISGVYGLWSPDRRTAYVGESYDVYARRASYEVARRLGCSWRVIRRLKASATKQDRLRAEAEVARYFLSCGVRVISNWTD